MAIKGGTSGIKYQLPSNAEITARQGAASASAGGSASAAAYGAERRMAGLKNQLSHDAQQSELDRIQQSEQNALNRDFQERSQLANHLAGFQQQRANMLHQNENRNWNWTAGQIRGWQAGQASELNHQQRLDYREGQFDFDEEQRLQQELDQLNSLRGRGSGYPPLGM